ncbi:Sterile alpha motif type 2 [Penicillium chermesinum]|nr:Sterile alpha motif type 2 [Penicillium chermesinum]
MDAQYGYNLSYMIPRKEEPLPLFPARTTMPRPLSEATEISDEEAAAYLYDSPMRSVASFGTGSVSTASTPDQVTTPESTGLTAFDFHIEDKNTRGPSGPHLFRTSVVSDHQSALEVDLMLEPTPGTAVAPFHNRASKLEPYRQDTPLPSHLTSVTPQPQYEPRIERVSSFGTMATADWSPQDVVQWMQSLGFESDIVHKFLQNDISGEILLELQSEDLKELDILSFGKRRRIMSSIQSLRSGSSVSGSSVPSSSRNSGSTAEIQSTVRTSTMMSSTSRHQSSIGSQQSNSSYNSCPSTDEDSVETRPRRRRQQSSPEIHRTSDVQPGDSVSIVAIEQLLPKMHNCSKGEHCRKWQKQQAKIARLAQDLPIQAFGGRAILTGDPGNPLTAPNLLKSPTKSEITPSIVASSDAMGVDRPSTMQLLQERLKEVQPQDPQENVRNYLNFQSLSKLQTVNDPPTPPRESLPSPDSESPDSAKITPTLADNLRGLPRLHIPSMHSIASTVPTENWSALKTVTPSILTKHHQLHPDEMTAIPGGLQAQSRGPIASPGDFYRYDPTYRQETPFSEVDVPVTAIPVGPVAREESQSVPPNMRFGNRFFMPVDPIVRPSSTKQEPHHRRCPSAQGGRMLNPLKEDKVLTPIETPEDLKNTPRAPHCRNNLFVNAQNGHGPNDATHSGWMKKRKTTRLLRHEWEDHHFTLKGTQLSMHNDEEAARRNSKALERIDVDDYAVACSSLASNSKLTAAFKKTVLKRRDNIPEESAFAFSLIPAPNNNGSAIDRKTLFLNSGKSHHFAVKTRDERIDWMRELMLAKALKRGREEGASVNMNGNMI